MAKYKQRAKPVYGPQVSPAIFEARWLAKFNALMQFIKFGAQYKTLRRFDYKDCKQTFDLIIAFAKEAKVLSLREDDFNTDPLPFEFVKGTGLLPIQHLNPFEAAEHYSEMLEATAVEERDIKQNRERRLVPDWRNISDEDIADVHDLIAGISKAKRDGLWPKERMPRRHQIVEEMEFLKWKALDGASAVAALRKN
ncbi:hypothetical protein PRZ48_013517 [Zasmidium cellare]|uniref:Uncharacterized protein n=1 Tax=Zasmidium cellare TaxID=395010 RepID=A0ABR0E1M3_ZASCE|nr:hypothetical protein PRZ48_013517 [Zasmidium cellare]